MAESRHILEAFARSGFCLRATFVWWSDRFGHVISLVAPGGQAETVLNSVEGDERDVWPASPPLQSLSLEELASGRQAALLVGMAGTSHWSASVETIEGRAALLFDVACRVNTSAQQPPVKLGSRYTLASGDIVSRRGDKQRPCIEIKTSRGAVLLHREQVPGGDVVLRLPESGLITIRPKVEDKTASSTVRWKYRVELATT